MSTTTTASASERITAEVTSWDGIEAGVGKRGEFGFRLGRREIGHLHGDHAAHFFFGKERWEELMAQGRIACCSSKSLARHLLIYTCIHCRKHCGAPYSVCDAIDVSRLLNMALSYGTTVSTGPSATAATPLSAITTFASS